MEREQRRETLDALLNRLIAKVDGVSEEEVTVEYIRQQREKRFYPTVEYEIGSVYGGYNHHLLRPMNRDEAAKWIECAEEPLKHL